MQEAEQQNEVTTPPEDVDRHALDRFLAHSSATKSKIVVRDRTGLRLSFALLLPITTGDDGQPRIWGASIILNSAELEFPQVSYKLRASAKRGAKPELTCNRSKGIIKQNDIFVLAFQLPESSIGSVQLTLIIDGSPHEVPLCKQPKADYFWIGKNTDVPGPECLNRGSPKMEPTPKNESPGRFEHLSDGLKAFLAGNSGLDAICKLLHPHAITLFRELSLQKFETSDLGALTSGDVQMSDVIAEEIVRRFHEANRKHFATTPALLQQQQ